jgi:antitoxin component of RelBE/YafQ-DinJ toxin-antitoxin module
MVAVQEKIENTKSTEIHLPVDSELALEAERVLENLGQDITSYLKMCLKYVTKKRMLPLGLERGSADNAELKQPKLGGWEDKIWISDDFDEPLIAFEEYMQ